MIGRTSVLTRPDGFQVFLQCWLPDGPYPLSRIALVHGFGEHSENYSHVARWLVERGHAVYSVDLRGHGRSHGSRGYISAWSEYREDVNLMLDVGGRDLPGIPVVLLGHSLGGLIAVEYALHHQPDLAGLVLVAPAVGEIGVHPALLLLSRLLSRVWPRFGLNTGIDHARLSRDPAAIARLDADPLVHGRGTARLGAEVMDTIARVRRELARLRLPLLLLHGGADQVTSPESSREFFDRVPTGDKTFRIYPGAYHNLFIDLVHGEVLADVDEWIRARAGEAR